MLVVLFRQVVLPKLFTEYHRQVVSPNLWIRTFCYKIDWINLFGNDIKNHINLIKLVLCHFYLTYFKTIFSRIYMAEKTFSLMFANGPRLRGRAGFVRRTYPDTQM